MGIVQVFVELWPNEVCDKLLICKSVFTSICLLELSHRLLLSHDVLHTSNYYIIKENDKEIKYSATADVLAHLPFYYKCKI